MHLGGESLFVVIMMNLGRLQAHHLNVLEETF
jgi:hypothetical protein